MSVPALEEPGRRAPRFVAEMDRMLVPGLIVLCVLFVFAVKGGGYDPTIWYPGALLVVALCVVALLFRPDAELRRGAMGATIALLAAFAVWTCLSVGWAGSKAVAWDGANMTIFYLAVFVLMAATPWQARTVAILLGAFSFVAAGTGVVEILRAASALDPTPWFPYGRFSSPFGYQNAACAWYLMAVWPALRLASSRATPTIVRVAAGAALTTLPALALLAQSRASLVAAPVTAAAYLLLVPGRARTLLYLLLAVAPAAFLHARLLHVFPAVREGTGIAGTVDGARNAVLLALLIGAGAALVLALLDRHVPVPRLRMVARRIVLGAALLALAAGIVVVAVALAHPDARAQQAWRHFKATRPATTSSYFANGLGSNRYDIWRVAVKEFERRPVAGIGVDNFASEYLAQRRSLETPAYPHSLELRILSQTGLVGGALFAGFVLALVLSLRRFRRLSGPIRAWSGTAVVMAFYWFVHSSVDWFWEIPALGGLAFACLGIAVSLNRTRRPGTPDHTVSPTRPTVVRRSVQVGLVAVLCVVAVSFVMPWFSAEDTVLAAASWRAAPTSAYSRLSSAAWLNPLSDRPYLVEGAIAARLGDRRRMRQAFETALHRNSSDWYAELELAVVSLADGQPAAATSHLARARQLNPRESSLALVSDAIQTRRPLPLTALDDLFLARIHS